jgi:8-oxo-dGTP diphosphatase
MSSGTYRNPAPTVDIIIEIGDESSDDSDDSRATRQIVLIKRKNEPHGWAIPGGFVDYGESVASAARREALEETSLEVELVELFHVYSDPARDPRGHTVSTVFIARSGGTPIAADDAAGIGVFTRDTLPDDVVFDHPRILDDYFAYVASGLRPPPER